MRRIWGLVCSLAAAFALASVASIASAQNGLQRFERDIKPQLELDKLTYSSASPLGSSGFVLNDVVAVVPATRQTGDKPTTVKIDKVTVEEFDFERVPPARPKGTPRTKSDNEDMPRFARMKFEGITGDDDINSLLAPYGIPRVPVDAAFDYRLDPATKVLTVDKIEVALRGLARAELSFVLDGISDKASKLGGSKDDGRLRTASLVFDDKGLLAMLLPAMAKQSGGTAESWIAMAQAPLQGFARGQGPETMKALDALASYLADWKAPKGPIRIAINPPKTTGLNDLDKIMLPNALTDTFGLVVSYEGTRPGAATASTGNTAPRGQRATPPQSATADPDAPGEGRGATRLNGKAAWDTVIGNTLTGKAGGKTYHDHYRRDGTFTSLQEGEIANGKWTLEGQQVCTKYPDEDKDCYSVVAVGRTVTMTDTKGKGFRATLLRGNPKDL